MFPSLKCSVAENVYFCNIFLVFYVIVIKNKHSILEVSKKCGDYRKGREGMKEMKIYAFADEASANVDQQIVAMKRNGLQGLEIRNVDGVNISDITVEKAKEVHQKLKEAGLVVWSIGSPLGKVGIEDDFEAHMAKFKHTLEIAKLLECNNIRLFSFYLPGDKEPERYHDEVICRLKKMVEAAKGSGIDLCHENEKGIYGDVAKRCLEIHKEIPELKGIFDPANFVQCGQDTLEAWELLQPYIKYLHIKDALADGMVVPAGAGIGHLKKILDAFRAKGGAEVTVEPHLTVFEGLRELEGNSREVKVQEFKYPDADTAFDVACNSLKELL